MPTDFEGYRRIRDAVHCRVTGGEHTFTLDGFRRLIVEGGVDIVQPDIYRAGGPTVLQEGRRAGAGVRARADLPRRRIADVPLPDLERPGGLAALRVPRHLRGQRGRLGAERRSAPARRDARAVRRAGLRLRAQRGRVPAGRPRGLADLVTGGLAGAYPMIVTPFAASGEVATRRDRRDRRPPARGGLSGRQRARASRARRRSSRSTSVARSREPCSRLRARGGRSSAAASDDTGHARRLAVAAAEGGAAAVMLAAPGHLDGPRRARRALRGGRARDRPGAADRAGRARPSWASRSGGRSSSR